MDKSRFEEICKEMKVSDEMSTHLWEHHRPPDHITEEQIRDGIQALTLVHEAQAMMEVLEQLPPGAKIPAA